MKVVDKEIQTEETMMSKKKDESSSMFGTTVQKLLSKSYLIITSRF